MWSILALTDYMVAAGELEADYAYQLKVGDTELANGTLTPLTIDRPIRGQVPVSELDPTADNPIIITRSANTASEPTGKLYYSALPALFHAGGSDPGREPRCVRTAAVLYGERPGHAGDFGGGQ